MYELFKFEMMTLLPKRDDICICIYEVSNLIDIIIDEYELIEFKVKEKL